FRFTNWVASLPGTSWQEVTKVDILNCMGLALALFAALAWLGSDQRVRYALVGAVTVAALAPIISGFDWSGVPLPIRDYLVPSPLRGRFPLFPCGAYVGFGLVAGAIVKRTAAERLDQLMQWGMLVAFALVFGGEYFANLPYSVYADSDFWRNSPALIVIRV